MIPDGGLDVGYEIQLEVHARRPQRTVVGRKIGLTSLAVQRQMCVDRPDFGVLFADMAINDDDDIAAQRLIQPRVEAEIAFVVGRDLPERPVTVADVLRAVDFVVPAIEIVDSRIADWDIAILDTVADNASSGCFVLGAAPRLLTALDDLRDIQMELCDAAGEVRSAGSGRDCLGHPVHAVLWLANEVASRGAPLCEGEVVLSGSLGPLVTALPGDRFEARFTGLGSVRVGFAR